MELIDFIGLAAGFFTTLSSLPQIIKAWKTKSTHDLSLPFIMLTMLGVALWLAYGLAINNTPLIIANILTFSFTSTLFLLKLKYK